MGEQELLKVTTEIEGKVLIHQAEKAHPKSLILSLHGYGESAEHMIERLTPWRDGDTSIVSVEALHPIYLPNRKIGHSWMTSHEREKAIVENLRYLEKVIDQISTKLSYEKLVVFGYSQGAQMAMRVARWLKGDQLIAIGAELPPELLSDPLYGQERLPNSVVIAKGKKDLQLSSKTQQENANQWEAWGTVCTQVDLSGAHRWNDDWTDQLTPHLSS